MNGTVDIVIRVGGTTAVVATFPLDQDGVWRSETPIIFEGAAYPGEMALYGFRFIADIGPVPNPARFTALEEA